MKKKYFYFIAFAIFLLVTGFIAIRYKNRESQRTSFYPLQDRKAGSYQVEEWKQVKMKFDELMKIVKTNPDDNKSRIQLASLYIQEARVTGNYMYYDQAAMKYVNEVLEMEPANFEALTFKSLIYLSQHHFADGLAIAEKARAINPYNAFVYGILVDGNIEMGNYTAAIEAADKMISIRPDIRSYSRISYLREIHGDYPGAIEAMKLATGAGPSGDEATEWTRVQLGHLYENSGDLKKAESCYLLSLEYRPGYAYATAGLARVAAASKNFSGAMTYYRRADSLVNDYSFKEQMAELFQMMGKDKEADELNDWLVAAMTKDAKEGNNNDNIGHYADRELAYTYLRMGDLDKAMEHALAEYNRRPENIDANETVAWMYYAKGEYKKAQSYLDVAMKTKSNNPVLLAHAGLILSKAGDKTRAKMLLNKVIDSKATLPESLSLQVAAELVSL